MRGDLLDIILLVLCLLFAISGYRQGFLIGILSLAGFLGGAVLGARYSSDLASLFHVHFNLALFGIIVVFVAASIGQLIAAGIAAAVRRRITWRSARLADAAAGAAISVLSVLLVGWLLGTAFAHSSLRSVARQVQDSAILGTINSFMPNTALGWFASFRRLVGEYNFPQVFGALGPEHIVPVAPPNPAVANRPSVRAAAPDIVKIMGVAPSCARRLEGSGFLYAPQHVITNAHVVAGVRSVHVFANEGTTEMFAQVVMYDPRRDVAVLYVPALGRKPLAFAGTASSGASAVVAGYPQNGPFDVVAARVRGEEEAQGPDIYQNSLVTRQIYSLRAVVRPGNSGGPLLATDGRVYGVVFAASSDNPDTGYALTAAEVAPDARRAARATAPTSTQGCD